MCVCVKINGVGKEKEERKGKKKGKRGKRKGGKGKREGEEKGEKVNNNNNSRALPGIEPGPPVP